jgi:hypothetical protein
MELLIMLVGLVAVMAVIVSAAVQPARPSMIMAYAGVVVVSGAVVGLALEGDGALVGVVLAIIGLLVGANALRRDAADSETATHEARRVTRS